MKIMRKINLRRQAAHGYGCPGLGRVSLLFSSLFIIAAALASSGAHAAWWSEGFKTVAVLDQLPGMPADLELDGTRVYLLLEGPANEDGAPDFRSIAVIDAANSRAPRLLENWRPETSLNAFAAAGGRLYAAESGGALNIYDMTQPAAPRRIGRYAADGEITRLRVAGGLACLVVDDQRLEVLDLAHDPPARLAAIPLPREFGHVALQLAPGHAFLAHDGHIEIYDLVDPARPALVRILSLPDPYDLVVSMAVEGERLYANTYWDIVEFNWKTGRWGGTVGALGAGQYGGGGAGRIALGGTKLFVPLHANGLEALATRANPRGGSMAGYYITPDSANAAATRGNLVFLATRSGLTILEATG